ncbi:lamin Dm0-like [Musca autumnalis]|uniref:lamin Dm0-like n=1 Tax=Musca autumnalis TaxID=221902 RepID=UPI003CE84EF6
METENVRGDVSRKFGIDINQIREENEQLKGRLDQKTIACSITEENARLYESRVEDLTSKYNAANAEKEKTIVDLDELRKEFEYLQKNIQSLREEITYKEQALKKYAVGFLQSMKPNCNSLRKICSRIIELEATNATLNARNYELEKLLDTERARHGVDISNMEADLQRCRDERSQQLQESAVDDKVLCGEEDISQTQYFVISREKDDVEIFKGDPKARVSKEGINEDGGATVFQGLVTDTAQEPPTKIMMKPRKWKSGENIRTTLYNANEEEVAGADRVKRTIIRHVSGHRIINEGSFSGEKYPTK